MKQNDSAREGAGQYAPGDRRDHLRARSDWHRQQYRIAEPEMHGEQEPAPSEPGAGGD